VDICGLVVVSRVLSPIARDEPPTRSSFLSLFLGGISWVFSRAHKRWMTMLGSNAEGYQTQREKKKSSNEKRESDTKSEANSYTSPIPSSSSWGARMGLFIGGDQVSHYNALNTSNHLSHQ
jgi:hypothetical protein